MHEGGETRVRIATLYVGGKEESSFLSLLCARSAAEPTDRLAGPALRPSAARHAGGDRDSAQRPPWLEATTPTDRACCIVALRSRRGRSRSLRRGSGRIGVGSEGGRGKALGQWLVRPSRARFVEGARASEAHTWGARRGGVAACGGHRGARGCGRAVDRAVVAKIRYPVQNFDTKPDNPELTSVH